MMARRLSTLGDSESVLRSFLLISMLLAGSSALMAAAEGSGVELFKKKRCNLCHGVESRGIEATTKSKNLQGPDLSDVGRHREEEWVREYLRGSQKIAGKAHAPRWRGSEAELTDLAGWLVSLHEKGATSSRASGSPKQRGAK